MAVICYRREHVRCLWSTLLVMTFVGCGAFLYISLLFGKDYHSEAERREDFSRRSEKLIEEKCTPVCNSEACVHHSNFLLNQVDPNVDPCENFYQFACGKYADQYWNETRKITGDMELRMDITLKNMLESMDPDTESAIGKVKTVYNSCIKEGSSDIQAIPTLLQYLNRFGIPDWPNLNSSFKFVEPNLIDVLGNFITYQEYAFITFQQSYFDEEETHLQKNVSVKILESAFEKKEKAVRKDLMKRTLQYFNLQSETINEIWKESEAMRDAITNLKQESERIYEINKISIEDDDNQPTRPIVLDCAEEKETEWKSVCGILESFSDTADVGAVLNKNSFEVYGESAYFVQNIFALFRNFSDRAIANYLVVNLMFKHMNDMNIYFQLTSRKDPEPSQPGLPIEVGNWQRCIEWLVANMYIPLSYVYINESLTQPVMQEVNNILEECIQESADAVSQQNWMSEATRIEYENDTRNLEYSLNNLPVLTNETALNAAYYQFHPTEGSFLSNVFEYQRFLKADEMMGYLRAANLRSSIRSFLKPDASGSSWGFNFQVGFIMPPTFRSGLERLINLVSVASIAAHEIGHSFFFRFGSNKKDLATKEYMEKAIQCVENQYSQFEYETIGKKVNGSQHIIENLADTAAIYIIDRIIERYVSEADAFSLPGFPYSTKQLLYISSIQEWCHSFTEREEEFFYKAGFHSIRHHRILGMMQNSRGFAETFHCSEDSFMNPSTKCLFPG